MAGILVTALIVIVVISLIVVIARATSRLLKALAATLVNVILGLFVIWGAYKLFGAILPLPYMSELVAWLDQAAIWVIEQVRSIL